VFHLKIINITSKAPYPPIQTWDKATPPEGCAEFPEQFLPVFYPKDKRFAGFVDITVEDSVVESCIWNEASYQAYCEAHPEQPAPGPDPESPVTWAALAAAYQAGVQQA